MGAHPFVEGLTKSCISICAWHPPIARVFAQSPAGDGVSLAWVWLVRKWPGSAILGARVTDCLEKMPVRPEF
jgi:hypothetical protein